MTTTAIISTTVPVNLGVLKEMNSMLQEFIEIGYGVQIISTTTNKDGEVFITLRGLDSNIRFYIKEEFNAEGADADQYISSTREGELFFWSLSIFTSYMVERGWNQTERLSEAPNPEKAVDIRLTKYLSPTKGVAVFLNRCFRNEPESIAVFSMDLDNPDDAVDGTQYVGEINYRDVLMDAEEKVQKILAAS